MIVAGISSLYPINMPFSNSYSKAYKIIIKLNNKSIAQALDSQSFKNIVKSINQYMKIKKIIDMEI